MLLTLLILLPASLPAQADGNARSEGLSAARARVGTGSPAKRIEHLEAQLRLDPADYEVVLDAAATEVTLGMLADGEDAMAHFRRAEDYASRALLLRRDGLDALYWHATSLGLLADARPARERVEIAGAVYDTARKILERDPDHPGAHHILGRLHGAAMRMPSPLRFLAGRLLGAELLRDASWEEAERHFEAAIAAEPAALMHHYELAAVYRDSGRELEAEAMFEATAGLPVVTALDGHFAERARSDLEQLR